MLLISILLYYLYKPLTLRIFARYEVLIRKLINLNIRILSYREFKNEMTYKSILNKEVT